MKTTPLIIGLAALLWLAPLAAQQFDNFGEEQPFDGFTLGEGAPLPEGEEPVPSLSEDGGLIVGDGTADSDIQLNLGGGPAGTFQTFPGVTGPVTSVSRPPTQAGRGVALRALDKMLGQPTDIELDLGQTVVFGRIAIRVQECRFPSADPDGDAFALVEVLNLNGETLFDGWMIASSPALSALEHARYDVWVLNCVA
ncbi:DUF2155 domain-containing protein [Gymnodinialimonas sp. 2305UL16-5]|uniref:DUF2155 domain-containing protein n=1 Tax=Gymnodinialimonas mytili TaxID=3126503 RepID=UPI00309B918B